MAAVEKLITDNLHIWTSSIKQKSSAGRGNSKKAELYGLNKLRELILDLAIRGLLVPQDPNDEPANKLLERINHQKKELLKTGKIKKPKPIPELKNNAISFSLPKGWALSCIAEIMEIGPKNEADDNMEASFVPMPLISTSYNGSHDQESRSWSEIKKGYTHFADGDVAIAKITPCFENSKAAIFSGLKNGIGSGTTELHVGRPFVDSFERRFILIYLKSPQFLKTGEEKMTGSAGQKRVPRDFFAYNPMPLPPRDEQHRIVAKVDELMALCDQLEQQTEASIVAHQTLVETLLGALTNAPDHASFQQAWQRIAKNFDTLFTTEHSIDQLKQTILQLAIMGKLVPQDPNTEPATELLARVAIEKREFGVKTQPQPPKIEEIKKPFELAKGWTWCLLDNLALHSEAGWSPKCEETPRNGQNWGVLKVSAVTWGEFKPEENKQLPAHLSERPEYEVKENDFLISRANTAELVARSIVVGKNCQPHLMISDKIIRFSFSRAISAQYINLVNNSLFSRSYYMKVAGGTSSSMKNVSRKQIQNLLIPLPPHQEQERIVQRHEELTILCEHLKKQISCSINCQVNIANTLQDEVLTKCS